MASVDPMFKGKMWDFHLWKGGLSPIRLTENSRMLTAGHPATWLTRAHNSGHGADVVKNGRRWPLASATIKSWLWIEVASNGSNGYGHGDYTEIYRMSPVHSRYTQTVWMHSRIQNLVPLKSYTKSFCITQRTSQDTKWSHSYFVCFDIPYRWTWTKLLHSHCSPGLPASIIIVSRI